MNIGCGTLSASISVTTDPTYYIASGVTITYTYTIKNTGTATICSPIEICDSFLGSWTYSPPTIRPGSSQNFTRTYVTKTDDLKCPGICGHVKAFIWYKPNCGVCTNDVDYLVKFGSSNVVGSLKQVANGGDVDVTLTLVNFGESTATGVSTVFSIPANAANTSTSDANVTINSTTLTAGTVDIAPNGNAVFSWSYTQPTNAGDTVTWAGTINMTAGECGKTKHVIDTYTQI